MNTYALLVFPAVLWLGGCDYQSSRGNFDRQIEACSVAEANGLLETAVESCGMALAIAEKHAYAPGLVSDLLYRLGRLERQRGNFQEAETLMSRSLAFEEKSGRQIAIATRLIELSLSAAGQGRWLDGAHLLERALPLVDELTGEYREAASNTFRAFGVRLARMGYTGQAGQFKDKAEKLAILNIGN